MTLNLKPKFAPLSIPLKRRLETFAVLCQIISLSINLGLFFIFCSIPILWPLIIIYLIYLVFDETPRNGKILNRRSQFIRKLYIFKLLCDYFPIKIHREVELEPTFPNGFENHDSVLKSWFLGALHITLNLFSRTIPLKEFVNASTHWSNSAYDSDPDPDTNDPSPKVSPRTPLKNSSKTSLKTLSEKNSIINEENSSNTKKINEKVNVTEPSPNAPRYIFGYHPHGIICIGGFGGIASEGAGWEKLFPGIPVSLLTLSSNLNLPIHRDYLLSLGISSVSRTSCLNLLKHGNSICIVLGGAQESLSASPNTMDLVLKKRKGFVKIAMSVPNTNLVPILSFGENDLFDQFKPDRKSKLYRFQTYIKDVLGFSIPFIHGRGIFNYDLGLMPYRRPINIIVGTPIPVPYAPDHPSELVDKYHEIYINELRRMWDKYKDKYFIDYTGKPCEFRIIE